MHAVVTLSSKQLPEDSDESSSFADASPAALADAMISRARADDVVQLLQRYFLGTQHYMKRGAAMSMLLCLAVCGIGKVIIEVLYSNATHTRPVKCTSSLNLYFLYVQKTTGTRVNDPGMLLLCTVVLLVVLINLSTPFKPLP